MYQNTDIKHNKRKRKDWTTAGSYIIIFSCVMLLLVGLFFYGYHTFTNNPKVIRVVTTTDMLLDSTKSYTYINYSQADSLIRVIKDYDDKLNQKYQYLIEQKEQNSQLFYWGSLIVGLVVAVFGWFGFKSFYAIENRVTEKAIGTARKNSRDVASYYWKKHGENFIVSAAEKYYKEQEASLKLNILDEITKSIEKEIDQKLEEKGVLHFQERLDQLESDIKRVIDESVENAFDDFLDGLKKKRQGKP